MVTVTETWTFVFDAADETTVLPALSLTPTELASIPTPSLDVAPPTADATDAPAVDAEQ